jgi:hypothetical protein
MAAAQTQQAKLAADIAAAEAEIPRCAPQRRSERSCAHVRFACTSAAGHPSSTPR